MAGRTRHAALALVFFPALASAADKIDCELLHTVDGDTVAARCGGEDLDLRLSCIDAPETEQSPWGHRAAAALDNELARVDGQFEAVVHGEDRYGRKIATLRVPHPSLERSRDLNRWLVSTGFVAVYDRYCERPGYLEAERRAEAATRGIWQEPGLHQRPWAYRRRE